MAEIGPVSFGGLTTGLDTKNLISQLLQLARLPQKRLEQIRSRENARITAFKDLNSKLQALSTALKKLETAKSFFVRTPTVSDTTKLDATIADSSQATVGTFSIGVKSLLATEKFVFNNVASDTTTVTGTNKDLTVKDQLTQATLFTVDTTNDGMSLQGLRDAINSATGNNGRVTATIIDTGDPITPFRLELTADAAGTARGFDVTLSSGFGLTQDTGASVNATDTVFSVNGTTYTRTTNTITDIISGVTLNLKGITDANDDATKRVTLTVSDDITAMANNIKAIVSAYNDVRSFVASKSTLDQKNPPNNGPFVGDGTVRGIIDRLQTELPEFPKK